MKAIVAKLTIATPTFAKPTLIKLPVSRLFFLVAVTATALGFNVSSSQAGGNAPWCAVIDYGDGGVSWDCYYRSFEECYPNVLAGNKGSCNLNPAGPGPAFTPAPYRHLRHYAH